MVASGYCTTRGRGGASSSAREVPRDSVDLQEHCSEDCGSSWKPGRTATVPEGKAHRLTEAVISGTLPGAADRGTDAARIQATTLLALLPEVKELTPT